jgi:hypothetical protein
MKLTKRGRAVVEMTLIFLFGVVLWSWLIVAYAIGSK